jgi:1-deoxyxylulose-5-phosphate synthase
MIGITRRDLWKSALAAGSMARAGELPAARRSATDWVKLGNSGVEVTRLAFGTGTFSGRVQSDLGQPAFTRLVRHAYDRGIRFFDSGESYSGTHQMLAIALKGLPRDGYRLMTKYDVYGNQDSKEKIDRFRRELGSEYIDILLIHYLRDPRWPETTRRVQDAFSEAKARKSILAHGVSTHGLPALATVPGNRWIDVSLVRTNHSGVHMDTPDVRDPDITGNVSEVVAGLKRIHSQGTGVLGMKLIGEGRFTRPEDREASIRFVMGLGTVDAVTIGYKSAAEVDEAIERVDRALNA